MGFQLILEFIRDQLPYPPKNWVALFNFSHLSYLNKQYEIQLMICTWEKG